MSWSTAQRDRERLYVNLSMLERLADYARRPFPTVSVPLLPGLEDTAQHYLGSAEGQGALAPWWKVFQPAVELLQEFRSQDLSKSVAETDNNPAYVADLAQALQASETALDAAVTRINFLAKHSPRESPAAKGA